MNKFDKAEFEAKEQAKVDARKSAKADTLKGLQARIEFIEKMLGV